MPYSIDPNGEFNLDSLRADLRIDRFFAFMERTATFGRGYQCFMESMMTPGRARLPRRLKKATKKYMRYKGISSMVIMPQGQFVCFKSDGRLLVCHAKY